MKRLLLSSLAGLILTAGSAFAADLYTPAPAYKAPPPPPPAVSWTGCYVDAGAGYGMMNDRAFDELFPPVGIAGATALTPTFNSGGEGWLGRLGGGCDYQIGSRLVVGAFADYDFTGLQGNFQEAVIGLIGTEKESSAWAAGGRVGFLVTPSLLTYVDGGFTQASFDAFSLVSSLSLPAVPTGLNYPAQTYNGWFVGGGTEYALSDFLPLNGFFWRTEYRYADYQAADLPILFSGVPIGLGTNMQKNIQTITTGLVWRFNFSGLTGARY
jgi:outer membrane immunogenic protein